MYEKDVELWSDGSSETQHCDDDRIDEINDEDLNLPNTGDIEEEDLPNVLEETTLLYLPYH